MRKTQKPENDQEKNPNPIDILVGNRIRLRRNFLGMTQEKLASLLGITFQQIQKYEKGINRVGASRLWDISNILHTEISYFYEDINKEVEEQSPRRFVLKAPKQLHLAEEKSEYFPNPLLNSETRELVTSYYKIKNRTVARQMLEMIKSLAKASETEDFENKEPTE